MNNFKSKLKTAQTMAVGALLLIVCAILFWAITNFDILVKAYKYPEAIRALEISVQIEKPATAAAK